jgi:hypothetical protein
MARKSEQHRAKIEIDNAVECHLCGEIFHFDARAKNRLPRGLARDPSPNAPAQDVEEARQPSVAGAKAVRHCCF